MKQRTVVVLVALMLAPVALAQADTITFNGVGLGIYNFSASYSNTLGTPQTHTYGYFAGQLRVSGVTSLYDAGEVVNAYCLDFFDFLSNPQLGVAVRPIDQYPGLPGDSPPNAVVGSGVRIGYLMSQYAAGANTPIMAGALQLAIWETALEAGPAYSLSSGMFTVGQGGMSSADWAAVTIQAGIYLNNIGSSSQAWWLDVVDVNGRGQDFAISAVPEPSSMLLLGAGLIGLGMVVRRKARK